MVADGDNVKVGAPLSGRQQGHRDRQGPWPWQEGHDREFRRRKHHMKRQGPSPGLHRDRSYRHPARRLRGSTMAHKKQAAAQERPRFRIKRRCPRSWRPDDQCRRYHHPPARYPVHPGVNVGCGKDHTCLPRPTAWSGSRQRSEQPQVREYRSGLIRCRKGLREKARRTTGFSFTGRMQCIARGWRKADEVCR